MEASNTSFSSVNTTRRHLLKGGLAGLLGAPLLGIPSASGNSGRSELSVPRAVTVGPKVKVPANMEQLFEVMKQTATDEQLYRFLYAMPKGGDLHHHLGGGFLPYMWLAIATDPKRNGGQQFYTRYQITNYKSHPLLSRPGVSHIYMWKTLNAKNYQSLPPEFRRDFKPLDTLTESEQAAWMSSVVLDEANEGRNEFFEYHWTRLGDLLASIHVLSECLVENMKLFGAEGTRYMEIQRGAFHYLDARGELLPPEVADAFWEDRLAQADAVATGVTVRWQGVVIRFLPNAEEMVRVWYDYLYRNRGGHWVGLNMAGREDDNRGYPARFTQVFDEMLAKYPGIGISIHAGESEKPDSYIRDTLRLGATRIGHGINLISDSDTMLRMRHSAFLVEINLISNELLDYVPDLDQHPFPVFFRQGIPCCLNTDDRGMWDSNFTDEYFVAVKRYNLSWRELQKLALDSYQHSFAEPELKDALVTKYKQDLSDFEGQFSVENWKSRVEAVPAITHGYGKNVLGLNLIS